MRRLLSVAGLTFVFAAAMVAWQNAKELTPGQKKDLTMPWAFPVYPINIAKDRPINQDDGKPKSIPGSTLSFTTKQINDYFSTPDWFPKDHGPWPKVVQYG